MQKIRGGGGAKIWGEGGDYRGGKGEKICGLRSPPTPLVSLIHKKRAGARATPIVKKIRDFWIFIFLGAGRGKKN